MVVLPRRVALGLAALGLTASVAGPVAYSLSTVDTPHSGAIVTAGPAAARSGRGGEPGLGEPGGNQGQADRQGQQAGRHGQFPPGLPAPGRQGPGGNPGNTPPGRGSGHERAGQTSAGGPMGGLLNGRQVGNAAKAS